ncbi:MAG: amidohydrolase [Fusobacteriaceae bacterium]|jgi:amidohydrolase|nr:amidohydrolase [Fusobacteriaceae bacterium]
MNIKELAEAYKDYIIERRHYYHSHPELTLQEVNTAKSIMEDLKDIGVDEIIPFQNGWHGCVGIINGAKPGKTVLLRADIDALPVAEETGLSYASEKIGVMHACGHDTHIVMLLGAAKILQTIKGEFSGRVKLLFQPAEELGVGAKEAIRQGFLDDVDACYGVHINPSVTTRKFNFESGARMASGDQIDITIEGFSAHGSAPHLGHDAIVAAGAVISGIQAIVSRFNNPLDPLVITLGTIHGGHRFNIIPGKVLIDGTSRYFNPKLIKEVEENLKLVVENISNAYGCKGTVEFMHVMDPLSNSDVHLVDLARAAVVKLYGKESLEKLEKSTGGEDFSYYMKKVPGVFGFVGTNNPNIPNSQLSLHHECFTIDEDVFAGGAAVAAQFAVDFLNE